MTNALGPAAIALAESIGEGISEVRALGVEREREAEIEEILGPEEFESLLLDGSASFEASAAPAPLQPAPLQLPNADVSQEVDALRAELARLSRQMRARDAYLQELERALEHNRRELATAGLSTGFNAARLFGRLRGQTFRIAELEADLRQAQLALATLRAARQAPVGARDDLRAIKGIGPRFAEQLYELGFTSYARIADLSSDEMLRIATRLRISAERIERDAWVEQARALIEQSAARGLAS